MSNLTPAQRALQSRFEGAISLAAPLLDVILGVGERISRIAEPTDHEYYPIRAGREARQLPDGSGEELSREDRSADEVG